MTKLGRRQTIKLGAAAAIVGPSVVFSVRTAAAKGRRGDFLGAYNFKVEIEGVTSGFLDARYVDLGGMTFHTNKATPSYDDIKVEFDKAIPELTRKFDGVSLEKGTSAAAHKISVSLYGKGGRTPAVTYHAIDARPFKSDVVDGANRLSWKVGRVDVEAHQLLHKIRPVEPADNKFAVEIAGHGLIAKHARTFVWNNKDAVLRHKFDPKPAARRSWTSDASIKYSELLQKVKAAKVRPGGTTEQDEVSFSFSKIDHRAVKLRDQFDLTTYVGGGATPASAIFVKTVATQANKASPDLMKPTAAKPVMSLKVTEASPTANKSTPVLLLSVSTGKPSPRPKANATALKLTLKSVEFPKLEVGSKALVTETLHFEVDPERR